MPSNGGAKVVSHSRFGADARSLRTPALEGPRQWARVLDNCRIGPWLWAGSGIRVAHVVGAAGFGEHLYLLKAQAGARLLQHGHEGQERVVVLQGSYVDGDCRYSIGDITENDHTRIHGLQATEDGPCVCLVATDGSLKFSGFARWIQILLRI